MKQKDIAVLIIVVFVSAISSFFISKWLFASPKSRQTKIEIVTPITADFPTPDSKYFNSNALDPTQLIQIGDSTNTQPFNGQ